MDWDQVRARWTTIRGTLSERWDALTDSDLDFIDARRERLSSRLQETYCITREEADEQIAAFLTYLGRAGHLSGPACGDTER